MQLRRKILSNGFALIVGAFDVKVSSIDAFFTLFYQSKKELLWPFDEQVDIWNEFILMIAVWLETNPDASLLESREVKQTLLGDARCCTAG